MKKCCIVEITLKNLRFSEIIETLLLTAMTEVPLSISFSLVFGSICFSSFRFKWFSSFCFKKYASFFYFVLLLLQRCQVLRFVRSYYAYAANIMVLRAAVQNYGFLILKGFFFFSNFFFYFKLKSLNITWTKIVTIFSIKVLIMLTNNCF